ncbi:MAG: zinc-binding dehydrogenase [Actinobacteria bacterium]|nr:zinc-binding dehydrogenase [Actinomycetota bacterium]
MSKTIKAAVMVEPGKMEVQQLPWPELERGALILKMHMSGICGTDKHAFKGGKERILYGGTEAEQEIVYPAVHGHENVGEIVEIHPEDKNLIEYHGEELKIGDRVTICPNIICRNCWYCRHIFAYPFCAKSTTIGLSFPSNKHPYVAGGWAEYMYVPPGAWVYKVPEDMPDELACMNEIFVVTATLDRAKEYSRLEARGFGFGDTVVVQGAGAMGLMHVVKAKILGAATIILVDPSEEKLNLAKEFGADYGINVSTTTPEERVRIVKDLTEGRGADVVVEVVGTAECIREGLEMTRRGGTYIETGNFVDTGEVSLNAHRHIAAKNLLLIGNTNHPHTGYYQHMKMMMK